MVISSSYIHILYTHDTCMIRDLHLSFNNATRDQLLFSAHYYYSEFNA